MTTLDLAGLGRVCLITGAGGGLGAEFAATFSRAGFRVVVSDLDLAAATATAQQLTAQGGDAWACKLDVSRGASVAEAFAEVDHRYGALDVVINNAGISGRPTAIDQLDDEEIDWVLEVDLKGPFRVARESVRRFRRSGGGCLINIASITGETGAAFYAPYAAAKAGVVALTRSLARGLGKYNVRVNCISPGSIVGTGFMAHSGGVADATRRRAEMAVLAHKIPVGRPAAPVDVAALALFLASPHARHIHGAVLTVDGGESLGSQ